jgi:hypothetical protein
VAGIEELLSLGKRQKSVSSASLLGARQSFLVSMDAPISSMTSELQEGERFLTRSFNSREQAMAWLTATESTNADWS